MEKEKNIYDPNGPITSASLTSTPALDFKQPEEIPLFPVAGLNSDIPQVPELQATAPEQEADSLSQRLQALNESLVGQSAYRSEQETKQGIPELQKTQSDLSARLKALQNEALAIPLQLQQESIGRGRTEGGLRPIQMDRLRTNAIQSLSVSSLLEASRGNLTLAMQNVERAVSQRFDPIKEEIAAKTANLDLILKSPSYSLADKKRAEAQKQAQEARASAIAKAEENNKIANAMAAAAVKLYPNDEGALMAANQVLSLDPSDPQYLQKAFYLLGGYQADPFEMQKNIDAHLQAQANLAKTNIEIENAPLERKRLEAQIQQIENDISLAPLQKEAMKANIAQSWASVEASKANIRKINAEIEANKPIDINAVTDPNAPAETRNQGVLTALLQNPKISAGTRTQIGNVLGVLNAVEDMAKQRQSGSFGGISPINSLLNAKIPFTNIGLPGRNALRSKEGTENEGYINAINLQVQTWASGASLTETQTEQVKKFTPDTNDTDAQIRTKVNNLANYMYTQTKSRLQSEGITFNPTKVNLFETYDMIQQASPEQKAILKQQGLIK